MRLGILLGIAAYGLWGLFPAYFHALDDAGSLEVLAHRIGWSLVVVVGLLLITRRLGALRVVARDRRKLAVLAGSALLIGLNWGFYIYAVSSDRVIEASLGYFITPLLSVGFGMLLFAERLRRMQYVALALGTLAVIELAAYYGGVPWIALLLALSFGTYGLLKKISGVGAAEGLTVETLVLLIPAVTYVLVLAWSGEGAFATGDLGLTLLLVAAGPVTAIPLLLFAACVARVPLSTLGLLQYLTPVLQFLLGWLAYGEAMNTARWTGFALVWAALALLTWDGLRAARRPAPVAEPLTAV